MSEMADMVDEKHLDRIQAIIRGMTPEERINPKILNASRRKRIANGSGVTVTDVNQLVERFFEAKKMMGAMAGQMGMGGMGKRSATKKNPKAVRAKTANAKAAAAEGLRNQGCPWVVSLAWVAECQECLVVACLIWPSFRSCNSRWVENSPKAWRTLTSVSWVSSRIRKSSQLPMFVDAPASRYNSRGCPP